MNNCKSGEDEKEFKIYCASLSVKAIRAKKWTAALFFFLLLHFVCLDEISPSSCAIKD